MYVFAYVHVCTRAYLALQTFHMQASSEVERGRWVTALELAKAKAIKLAEAGELSFRMDG